MIRRLHYEILSLVILFLAACAPLGAPQAAFLPVQPTLPAQTRVSAPVADPQPALSAAIAPTSTQQPAVRANQPTQSLVSAPQKVEIHEASNVAYAHTAGTDAALQMLDVYYAEPASAHRPVMIYIHGGGWTSGDKSHVDVKPQFFVQAGYVFISVNYRLSPQALFPAHVQDVAAAVAWAVKNIAQYGGDSSRIFVSGHSAGGHLAVLVASDDRYLKELGLSLAAIKGVVSIDTAGYDFSVFASRCKNHILPEPYSIPFGQNPAFWKMASPVTYIAAGKQIPPMALVYSGDVGIGSDVKRALMAEEFSTRLTAAAIPNTLIGAVDKNHGQINSDFGLSGDVAGQKVLEFLKKIN
jgi:acetyl esterase/lipase